MKLPALLYDYLEETEQDADRMTQAKLLEEARWVLWNNEIGEGYGTPAQVRALKMFIRRVSQ